MAPNPIISQIFIFVTSHNFMFRDESSSRSQRTFVITKKIQNITSQCRMIRIETAEFIHVHEYSISAGRTVHSQCILFCNLMTQLDFLSGTLHVNQALLSN